LSSVRVTYSGLIALIIGLSSVITGIIFTLIVTRRLSPEDFGIWSIIGSMISYFIVIEPIISYWSTRQIARGEDVGKTSLISGTFFAFGSIPIYLAFAFFMGQNIGINTNVLFLGALLLPVVFISQILVGINLGHKPQATSYGILGFEVLKVPAGLALVYFLDLGISGAIYATLCAYLIKIVIQLYFAKSKLHKKFSITVLRRWFKLFWIPLYSNISHLIWILDVVLYASIIGSTVGVAYYAASLAITALITHSGLVSQALYPKLISEKKHEHVKDNFSLLFYFAIPMLGISIIFSKYALFALNPAYEIASYIVIFISIRTFFYVLTGVLYQVLKGIEKVDVEKNPSFRKLAKSNLFLVPSLSITHSILYIGSLTVVFVLLNSLNYSELEIVTAWSIIMVVLQIPVFLYSLMKVRKQISLSLPYQSIIKYSGATLAFSLVFFLTAESIINYKTEIFVYLPTLLLELVICIAIYLAITLLIDKKIRNLFRAILTEILAGK